MPGSCVRPDTVTQCMVKKFTSDVKIKSISIVGGADGTSPSKMRAFINREGIDFSDAQSMQAVQEWDLAENLQGVLEYQTRYSKFQGVGNLTLHFPDNFGGDTSRIQYIGLKGEATQLKRDAVVNIVYELMPNPSDHKAKSETGGGMSHVEVLGGRGALGWHGGIATGPFAPMVSIAMGSCRLACDVGDAQYTDAINNPKVPDSRILLACLLFRLLSSSY
ncbi:PITH domain-containing protein 1 [Tanacetum coccineum]